ncbi:MAG: ABC transporter permease, partial [Cellulomonas sp.]|nr:ABC transporter permease [Cellulomonas sp.]
MQNSIAVVRDVRAHHELLGLLVRREIRAKYKDSALGLVWTLVRPLVMLVIYYVAVGKFLQASRNIPGFAVYIFAGLTAWGLFSDLVTNATASIVNNGGLVKKVYLPREIFPLSAAGSALFTFAVQLAILVVAMLVGGVPPAGDLLYFPL